MLINPEIVCNLINRVHELQLKRDVDIPDDTYIPVDVDKNKTLVEQQGDFWFQELEDLFNDLESDQQEEIIALMFIGRGDFSKDEWELAIEQAHNIPETERLRYLTGKPLLADFLEEGLSQFGYSCEE